MPALGQPLYWYLSSIRYSSLKVKDIISILTVQKLRLRAVQCHALVHTNLMGKTEIWIRVFLPLYTISHQFSSMEEVYEKQYRGLSFFMLLENTHYVGSLQKGEYVLLSEDWRRHHIVSNLIKPKEFHLESIQGIQNSLFVCCLWPCFYFVFPHTPSEAEQTIVKETYPYTLQVTFVLNGAEFGGKVMHHGSHEACRMVSRRNGWANVECQKCFP